MRPVCIGGVAELSEAVAGGWGGKQACGGGAVRLLLGRAVTPLVLGVLKPPYRPPHSPPTLVDLKSYLPLGAGDEVTQSLSGRHRGLKPQLVMGRCTEVGVRIEAGVGVAEHCLWRKLETAGREGAVAGRGVCGFPDTEFIIGRFLFTVPRHLPREPRARNV